MARYIDADFVEYLIDHYGGMVTWNKKEILGEIKKRVQIHSTADVVPKSEVEELIYKLECLLCHATGGLLSKHTYDLRTMESVVTDYVEKCFDEARAEAKTEVAEEIFAEIENTINNELQNNYKVLPQVEFSNEIWNRISGRINALQGIRDFIAELKKKYTEAPDA